LGSLRPFVGLALAAPVLLYEPVGWTMIAVTTLAVLHVACAKRFA
jgi:hypothetical protein